jgi:hypothetical protein
MRLYTTACPRCGATYQDGQWKQVPTQYRNNTAAVYINKDTDGKN